ncbi:hypothetical protein MIND_00242800 [Mycena indigotica]|uniref:Uncharacterized protein n=1 Tax=Mycena indigotica TaxID=2126181 RepID=A0A8H6T5R6_9AGAR|nr:uncharacterized protein MIND_00242800 [Mycena indigotica]KAF7312298.1 hypothetical protein MIND_00242800 [Mycena indigotica]
MKVLSVGVLCLSVVLWRNKHPLRQMLFKRELPLVHYSGGAASDCAVKIAPEFTFCEDATLWELRNTSEQRVLVSCDPGRKAWNTVLSPMVNPDPHGSLWVIDNVAATPRRLQLDNFPSQHDFHPLGVAISPFHGDAPSNLFVVNHARKRSFIEQFTLSPGSSSATYIRTLTSPYFIAPNSISLTSPNSFYLSNDHLLTRRLPFPLGNILPLIETVLTLPLAWVSHITLDPDPLALKPIVSHAFAAPFVPYANGVAISPSGNKVAIASTSRSLVYIYARNEKTNALTQTAAVPVPFHPDNLEFDHSGELVVAGHPHFGSVLQVKSDPTAEAVAPSWVVSIDQNNKVTTLFQSNGTVFSTSTTGLRDHDGHLFISGLYSQPGGVLACK